MSQTSTKTILGVEEEKYQFMEQWQKDVVVASYQGNDRVVHFTEYLENAAGQKPLVLMSGYEDFDAKLGGLMMGEVTVISGKTGEGKTLFAESWIRGLTDHEASKACIFSYEVQPSMMLEKYRSFPDAQIYLPMSLRTMDISWLKERVFEAREKFGCRIFLFDHLHFLIDMSTKQNMSLNIGAFMRQIKQEVAIGMDVAVILIAHQKGVARGTDPSLEDVRDSTFIAQEADNVVIVWRRKDFLSMEIEELRRTNPSMAEKIETACLGFNDLSDPFARGFEMVQIAKARRVGTYRWNKLFKKTGDFFVEV